MDVFFATLTISCNSERQVHRASKPRRHVPSELLSRPNYPCTKAALLKYDREGMLERQLRRYRPFRVYAVQLFQAIHMILYSDQASHCFHFNECARISLQSSHEFYIKKGVMSALWLV